PGGRAVRLLGARVLRRRGVPVAAVAYQVGQGDATLLVSRAQPAGSGNTAAPKHPLAKVGFSAGARAFSWSMRQQTYALATSVVSDPQIACLLCHTSAPQRITVN